MNRPFKDRNKNEADKCRSLLADFVNGEHAITGIAAIEFSIFGSVLCMLLLVGVDLGLAFHSEMQVQTSAQSGAEYAAVHGFDSTGITQAISSATPASGIGASPTPSQFCGCPSSSTVTEVSCNSTCADGAAAGTYVKVTATRSYTMLIPYRIFPSTYTQTAVSTVRIK